MSVNQYMSRDVLLNLMINEKIYEKNRNKSLDIFRTIVTP